MGDRRRARTTAAAASRGTLGVTRPDIATQVRFRKEEEMRKGEAALRELRADGVEGDVKILTSLPVLPAGPVALQRRLRRRSTPTTSWSRWRSHILGENWMPDYVRARQRRRHRAGAGLMKLAGLSSCATGRRPRRAAGAALAAGARSGAWLACRSIGSCGRYAARKKAYPSFLPAGLVGPCARVLPFGAGRTAPAQWHAGRASGRAVACAPATGSRSTWPTWATWCRTCTGTSIARFAWDTSFPRGRLGTGAARTQRPTGSAIVEYVAARLPALEAELVAHAAPTGPEIARVREIRTMLPRQCGNCGMAASPTTVYNPDQQRYSEERMVSGGSAMVAAR